MTQTLEEVRARLEGLDEEVADELLSDVVHEICSRMGSEVNSGGIDGQVEFIVENGGGESAAVHLLGDLIDQTA